jgi:hypothetical protein
MVPPSSWLKCVSSDNALVYGQLVRNVAIKPKGGERKRKAISAYGKNGLRTLKMETACSFRM